jgi:hypothetical protein
MSIAGAAMRRVNRLVRPFGFEVRRVRRDLDCALLLPARVEAGLRAAAQAMVAALSATPMSLDEHATRALAEDVVAFHRTYAGSPVRAVNGGARLNKLLWLFAVARLMRPSVIIESGTFRGTSAWTFAQACPDAVIHSFDIEDAGIAERAPSVRYHRGDWSRAGLDHAPAASTLLFFDDHVDQARRVLEASARGYRWLLFDDDPDVLSFPRMAPTRDHCRNWRCCRTPTFGTATGSNGSSPGPPTASLLTGPTSAVPAPVWLRRDVCRISPCTPDSTGRTP